QLKARWRQAALLVFSVAIGVAILTTALSLTNGFEKDLIDRILGTTPHVTLSNPFSGTIPRWEEKIAVLRKERDLLAVTPFINGKALLMSPYATEGALVRGIDPRLEGKDRKWQEYVLAGDLHDSPGFPGLLLGSELAKRLGVGIGDRLSIFTGGGKVRCLVTGIFQAGLYEYDARIAFLTIPASQGLFHIPGRISGISLRLSDVFAAPRVAKRLDGRFNLTGRPWTESNRSLLGALALEKRVIFLVVLFIVVIAMLGISNTLAMWVLEMRREMSILRAVGTTSRQVGFLMAVEGLIVSFLGVSLGSLAGFLLSLALTLFPIGLPSDVYYISRLPVEMRGFDFLLVAGSALLISLLACLLPMRKAARLDPIEVIRQV
ncbi:MAG TPA: ABC transporter permease, partial [Chroococcales cyanobacterium]